MYKYDPGKCTESTKQARYVPSSAVLTVVSAAGPEPFVRAAGAVCKVGSQQCPDRGKEIIAFENVEDAEEQIQDHQDDVEDHTAHVTTSRFLFLGLVYHFSQI